MTGEQSCRTELEPEEYDENGECMTLTCIGFRPLRMKSHIGSATSSICFERNSRS